MKLGSSLLKLCQHGKTIPALEARQALSHIVLHMMMQLPKETCLTPVLMTKITSTGAKFFCKGG